jgi:hypothetical protein
MGNQFITKEQAADLLDCHIKSIYRYAKRGLVRSKFEGKRFLVNYEDILTLRKGRRDPINSPYTRDTINLLLNDVQTLKTQMSTVLRILNINYVPLNLTDPEYRNLYLMAEQFSMEGWSPHVEEQWADVFIRLKIEDLDTLERVTGDPHPWRHFMRFVTTMHIRPWNAGLRDMLGSGRSNVHQIAGIWCVMKDKSAKEFQLLVDRDAAPVKKLIRRLSKEQSS